MSKRNLSRHARGVLCIIVAAFGFSLMTVFVKLSGDDLPPFQKAFFRNIVALVLVGGMMWRQGVSPKPEKENWGCILGRAFFGTAGLLCNFYAIGHLVLADANMLNKLSPFFAIVFSIFLLREKPSAVQIGGVLVALAGSMLIIKPGFDTGNLFAAFMGLCGGAGAGLAYTFVRKLGMRGENGMRIIFYFSLFSCAVTLPFVLFSSTRITAHQLLMLIIAGVFGCIGQFGITRAYVYAPAREISVYDYTQVLFAAVLGYFVFGQIPDGWSILGYILICGAGIGMFLYHRALDRRQTAAAK